MGRKARPEPIPERFDTLEQAGEFWDSHDLADYDELTEPVEFVVKPGPQTIVLGKAVTTRLRAEARRRHVGMANLATSLLREGLRRSGT